jgi:hypothetical protein
VSDDSTQTGTPASRRPGSGEPRSDATGPVEPVFIDPTTGEAEQQPASSETEEGPVELVEPRATGPVLSETPVAAAEPVAEPERPIVEPERPAAEAAFPVQTIYVQAPVPPRRQGNRGVGSLIALLAALVFAVLYALAVALIRLAQGADFQLDLLLAPAYFVPVLFFLCAFVLLVLIVNRGAWWAYILGSLVVGLIVYFGTIGVALLVDNVILMTPSEAARAFAVGLSSPYVIAAALLAREVSMWSGSLISYRGRKVKERNLEARAAFERETAERRAEYERARASA